MLEIEPRKIVVGVTQHDTFDAVLEYAAIEATRRGCGIHLVVVEHPTWDNTRGQSEVELFGDDLRRANTTLLLQCEKRVRSWLGGPGTVSTEIVHGPVAQSLCRVAENSEMVALEHHRMGHAFHLPTLSVTNGVASRATVPVVAVPDGWRESQHAGGPVVAGIEDADRSWTVAETAFDEARRMGTGVRLVHAWSWADEQVERVRVRTSTSTELTSLLRDRLGQELKPLTESYPDVEHELVVVLQQPAYALMGESVHARLVVVGRHEPQFRFGSHLGPVTRTVITYAHCPVLVVDTRASASVPPAATVGESRQD